MSFLINWDYIIHTTDIIFTISLNEISIVAFLVDFLRHEESFSVVDIDEARLGNEGIVFLLGVDERWIGIIFGEEIDFPLIEFVHPDATILIRFFELEILIDEFFLAIWHLIITEKSFPSKSTIKLIIKGLFSDVDELHFVVLEHDAIALNRIVKHLNVISYE